MSNEVNDLQELTTWLKKEIKDIDNSVESKSIINKDYSKQKLPVLATLLTFNEHEINKLSNDTKKTYEVFLKRNKELIASVTALNLGTSVMSGVGLSTLAGAGFLGMAGIGTIGLGGFISVFNPGLLGAAAGFAIYKKSKKILEKRKESSEREIIKNDLQELQSHCESNSFKLKEHLEKNCKELTEIFNKKMVKAMEIAAENSKKIAIQIDDALNFDVNKRIMQYQEIVVKQYDNQVLIQEQINKITEAYNNLVKENERLSLQIQEYEAKLNCIKQAEANFLS